MIITADTITLSFLVVAAVTLAVVSVLVWYVYSSKRFRQDMIDLMDKKLDAYLKAQQPQEQEEEEIIQQQANDEEGEHQAKQQEVAEELSHTNMKDE